MTQLSNLKGGEIFVAKIQLPLSWSKDLEPEALVYNKGRSVITTMPITDGMKRLFGSDVKQYWLVEAVRVNNGILLQLRERVEDAKVDF